MKKCEYCGKQISYFDQYCSDDCHMKANNFYDNSRRFGKLFSVVNTVCVFGIPIGMFAMTLARIVGLVIADVSCVILGAMLIALPFPTEGMISRHKIKKAKKITRIIGAAVVALAPLITLLAFIISFD